MKLMWFVFAVGSFVLVTSNDASGTGFASMDLCNKPSAPLIVPINEPFEVCCMLSDSKCNETSLNDSLTLSPVTGCDEECQDRTYMIRENDCLVKFGVNNATKEDEGDYKCYLNGEVMRTRPVRVDVLPGKPVFGNISSTQNMSITLTFTREVSTGMDESYVVTLTDTKSNLTLCAGNLYNNTICDKNTNNCTCKYTQTDPYKKPADGNVTVTIRVTRGLLSVETSQVYNLVEHIIPGQMKKLRVVKKNASEAHVQFCLHRDTYRLVGFMENREKPLVYKIHCATYEGIPHEIQLAITYELGSLRDRNRCLDVHFANLTAFTKYVVTVSGVGGGGEGPKVMTQFITGKKVPDSPLLDNFSFMRVNYDDEGRQRTAFSLFWKPLPHASQGGVNISYLVELKSASGEQKYQTEVKEPYMVDVNHSSWREAMIATVWAKNEIGISATNSTISVPSEPEPEIVKPRIICESHLDKNRCFVNAAGISTDSQNFFACSGSRHRTVKGLVLCRNYLQRKLATHVNTSSTIEECSLTDKKSGKQEVEESWELYYFSLKKLDSPLVQSKQVIAHVIFYFSKDAHPVVDYEDDYDFVDEGEDDYYYYYNYGRRKRSLPPTQAVSKESMSSDGGNETATTMTGKFNEEQTIQISLPTSEPVVEKDFTDTYILLSWETQGRPSGLIAADCYFDKTKNNAEVVVSQIKNAEDGKEIKFLISQKCDADSPQQFLADSFAVYTANDLQCSEDITFEQLIVNRPLQELYVTLKESRSYICVSARRNETNDVQAFATLPVGQPIDTSSTSSGSEKPNIWMIIGIVGGIVFLLIGLGCLTWRCYSSKKKIKKYLPMSPLISVTHGKEDSSEMEKENGSPPEVPSSNIPGSNGKKTSNPSTSNNDSGMCTDLTSQNSQQPSVAGEDSGKPGSADSKKINGRAQDINADSALGGDRIGEDDSKRTLEIHNGMQKTFNGVRDNGGSEGDGLVNPGFSQSGESISVDKTNDNCSDKTSAEDDDGSEDERGETSASSYGQDAEEDGSTSKSSHNSDGEQELGEQQRALKGLGLTFAFRPQISDSEDDAEEKKGGNDVEATGDDIEAADDDGNDDEAADDEREESDHEQVETFKGAGFEFPEENSREGNEATGEAQKGSNSSKFDLADRGDSGKTSSAFTEPENSLSSPSTQVSDLSNFGIREDSLDSLADLNVTVKDGRNRTQNTDQSTSVQHHERQPDVHSSDSCGSVSYQGSDGPLLT